MTADAHAKALAKIAPMICGPEGACWNWQGSRTSKGYGRVSVRVGDKTYGFTAHRLSYEIAAGPIPPGLYVCHSCDNPSCFNPAHLWAGSGADNARDREQKGRGANSRKTHCPSGHPYSGDNLGVLTTTGVRYCRECNRASARENQRKLRARRRLTREARREAA